jgi:hypothetical protein
MAFRCARGLIVLLAARVAGAGQGRSACATRMRPPGGEGAEVPQGHAANMRSAEAGILQNRGGCLLDGEHTPRPPCSFHAAPPARPAPSKQLLLPALLLPSSSSCPPCSFQAAPPGCPPCSFQAAPPGCPPCSFQAAPPGCPPCSSHPAPSLVACLAMCIPSASDVGECTPPSSWARSAVAVSRQQLLLPTAMLTEQCSFYSHLPCGHAISPGIVRVPAAVCTASSLAGCPMLAITVPGINFKPCQLLEMSTKYHPLTAVDTHWTGAHTWQQEIMNDYIAAVPDRPPVCQVTPLPATSLPGNTPATTCPCRAVPMPGAPPPSPAPAASDWWQKLVHERLQWQANPAARQPLTRPQLPTKTRGSSAAFTVDKPCYRCPLLSLSCGLPSDLRN